MLHHVPMLIPRSTSFESQLPGTVLAIVYVIFYEIHYLNPWASAFWHLVISKVYVVCLLGACCDQTFH
jgi:hypothetical protein